MAATAYKPRPTNGQAERVAPPPTAAPATAPTLADKVTYWLVMASVYIGFGFMWYYPFKSKIFDQDASMPASTKESFEGTFLDTLPGLDLSWALLGIMEGIVVVALVASLIRREFMPERAKPILFGALAFSLLTLATLMFGGRMEGEHETVANLAGYFGMTAIVMILLLLMPPYRGKHWLSSLTNR